MALTLQRTGFRRWRPRLSWTPKAPPGRLVLFDGPSLKVDLDASYEVVDDHTFTAGDAGQNIDGTDTFKYRINGDRPQVRVLQNDPFFITTWEATPVYRSS